MTRAANSAKAGAAPRANAVSNDAANTLAADERLLERLCALDAEVVYFPVRHHSPVCAQLVAELIGRMRPAAVLIEGPSDYNERFDELLLEHELPIAIYSYFRSAGEHSGAYYPFCEYSPEWSALRTARAAGASVRFIDLPWTEVAPYDRTTHRFADAELRRGRYVQNLCARLHVEDFDELWDKLIEAEQPCNLNDYMQRVHSLCYHTRLWDESVSTADRQREKYMAEQIQRTCAEVKGPVLVVTGGYHSSALAARREGLPCPGTDDTEPSAEEGADKPEVEKPEITESGIALTTYSYERLDNLTGYNAGMPSPGFYEHAWRQRQAGQDFDHRDLLVSLVTELRERKQTLSTADLIAVETSARALAALRGRTHVWRRDLLDGVTLSLIKDELEYGCASPFVSAIHAVLRGRRRGRLAEGTRLPPLVHDIRQQLADAKLEATHGVRSVELSLLEPADLAKSRLLHRLKVLGIVGYDRTGGTDFLGRGDMTRLWETWRIRWSPEYEGTCIEAARYGTSLADAVAARFAEEAGNQDRDAAAAAALLVQAAQAGIETISESLLQRLTELIREESQFTQAATALGHILFLHCYDEAFGTCRLAHIGQLLVEGFGRTLWLLEMLGQGGGNESTLLRGMRTLLETFQRSSQSVDLERDVFVAVMLRVEGDGHKPPALRGAAAGILWTLGAADEERILADLRMFSAPSELGEFLAGLFALAREVAQRHAPLVQTIDRMLNEFSAGDFQTSLPSLRLAFTYFTPREKHYMLTTLFESLGLKEAKPLAALKIDPVTAAEALAFEERLFETIAKYGLEESHG